MNNKKLSIDERLVNLLQPNWILLLHVIMSILCVYCYVDKTPTNGEVFFGVNWFYFYGWMTATNIALAILAYIKRGMDKEKRMKGNQSLENSL